LLQIASGTTANELISDIFQFDVIFVMVAFVTFEYLIEE